jgi:hypothetical protein
MRGGGAKRTGNRLARAAGDAAAAHRRARARGRGTAVGAHLWATGTIGVHRASGCRGRAQVRSYTGRRASVRTGTIGVQPRIRLPRSRTGATRRAYVGAHLWATGTIGVHPRDRLSRSRTGALLHGAACFCRSPPVGDRHDRRAPRIRLSRSRTGATRRAYVGAHLWATGTIGVHPRIRFVAVAHRCAPTPTARAPPAVRRVWDGCWAWRWRRPA